MVQAQCPIKNGQRATPNSCATAVTVLSAIRYEINRFRDSRWEGIVHARNRLIDTSVALGAATYALLTLAIITNPPHEAIRWAAAYFLIGVIIGLFARSQTEWTAETAIDDFGLSTARLIHIPWLSGLAAVGGVLAVSVLDNQLAGNVTDRVSLVAMFDDNPSFLVVAAIFGLTPDLIIRRLSQQVEKYKADLESTQSSQSIETNLATK